MKQKWRFSSIVRVQSGAIVHSASCKMNNRLSGDKDCRTQGLAMLACGVSFSFTYGSNYIEFDITIGVLRVIGISEFLIWLKP